MPPEIIAALKPVAIIFLIALWLVMGAVISIVRSEVDSDLCFWKSVLTSPLYAICISLILTVIFLLGLAAIFGIWNILLWVWSAVA